MMCDKCGKDMSVTSLKKHVLTCDGTFRQTKGVEYSFVPHPTDPTRCPEADCEFRWVEVWHKKAGLTAFKNPIFKYVFLILGMKISKR